MCAVCLSGQDAPSFGLDSVKMHPSFDRMCVHVVCVCLAKMLHLSANVCTCGIMCLSGRDAGRGVAHARGRGGTPDHSLGGGW